MTAKIERRGDELIVVIPEEVAAREHLKEGANVEVITVPARKRPTLEELVAGITDENRHDEMDWGPPVGNEVW